MLLSVVLLQSCESFLEPDSPKTQVIRQTVFADDISATAAMTGVYQTLYRQNSFAGGANVSFVALAGLSADELRYNGVQADVQIIQFEENELRPENDHIFVLWSSMYEPIYQANAILESLSKSTGLTQATRNQLRGESLFIRAFCHFYLVNLFGDVPLVLTTDYEVNSKVARTSSDLVYEQIINDLIEAEGLLMDDYPSGNLRIRVNKYAATAMLARVYLYTGDWQRAEDKATNVISKTALYSLPSNLNSVFISNSAEAIWQLKPSDASYYTWEGYYFGTAQGTLYNVLRESVVDVFEPNDKRRTNWVTSLTNSGVTTYMPYKYKLQYYGTPNPNELSMVLRLAEQYLIRAEARLKQHKLPVAIDDVDVIRTRAGITLIKNTDPAITEDELQRAIEQERHLEFLTEWGHRWLDLKRWDRANNVLGPIKSGWSTNDQLYPLPSRDMIRNTMLRPQNDGY